MDKKLRKEDYPPEQLELAERIVDVLAGCEDLEKMGKKRPSNRQLTEEVVRSCGEKKH